MPASDGYATEIGLLEAALSSGEDQIRGADGKTVIYRSAGEIREAIGYFRGQATAAIGTGSTTYASFGRGPVVEGGCGWGWGRF